MEENKFENIEGVEHLKSRDEIEKKAIEITIKEELKENRKVIITPREECYDILSIGENPNDIRYIEVKGHAKNQNLLSMLCYQNLNLNLLKRKEINIGYV
jgi:hypothetical protein